MTYDELMQIAKEAVSDVTSDAAIRLFEGLDDYNKSYKEADGWKGKYDELDAIWRKRYVERFMGTDEKIIGPEPEPEPEPEYTDITFDDIWEDK